MEQQYGISVYGRYAVFWQSITIPKQGKFANVVGGIEDDDWWVIRHNNGTWLYFPNGLLSKKDMEILPTIY